VPLKAVVAMVAILAGPAEMLNGPGAARCGAGAVESREGQAR